MSDFNKIVPCLISRNKILKIKICFQVSCQQGLTVGSTLPPVFSPIVTATCRAGVMTVKVETLETFLGVVQSRDYRKPECSSYGENTRVTYLRINMLSQVTDSDYCGVFITDVSTTILPGVNFSNNGSSPFHQTKNF